MDTYDTFPYESIAFPDTHPNHLGVLGLLLGLQTAPPRSGRVLEIGCAGGGNLIPMAFHMPEARFLGIDLSARQIETGRALVRRLGLDNIDLRQGDILELDTGLGEFDYIIAHGVYSWIPQRVRGHLLDLVPGLLAPAGLFYVSYNTLPGWRMRGMLRDILNYGDRKAEKPEVRVAAARRALARLRAAIEGSDALSSQYLREEIAHLERTHPSYLLFEYLAETSQAFLFSDFAADAEAAALRYLCDTDLRTLFPSSYGAAVERALAPIEDGAELEQWLDFVTNRNFRQSVLCRSQADLPEAIAIDLDRFALLAFRSDLRPTGQVDLKGENPAAFATPGGVRLSISHPLTKAVVLELSARYPDCLHLRELMPAALERVETGGGSSHLDAVGTCLEELFSLFAHAGIRAQPTALSLPPPALDRPRVAPLAAAQVATGAAQVTTLHHGNLDLDAFAAQLIGYLDGSRTPEEAAQALARDLATERLRPPQAMRSTALPSGGLETRVREAVDELVRLFARQGILASAAPGP